MLTSAFILLQVGLTLWALLHRGETDLKYFTYDDLGILFLGLLTAVGILSVYHGFIYFKYREAGRFCYYHAALVGLIASISGAYLANDVTVVWILVEATTLTASVLIYHEKTKAALEATWKYIFLCSTGIAFAYMGILFMTLSLKGSELHGLNFATLTGLAGSANPLYLKIAFIFVFIGYSTKMELFPMHTVGIDANSVAPSPIGALFSSALVNLGFLSIFRIYKAMSGSPIFEWMNHILILSGVLSILVAGGYMLKAKYPKRMLAYSSLEIMGLVSIGIGMGGVGYYAALLILVVHTLVKSSLFFQMGQVNRVLKTLKLDESGRYLQLNPAGALVLLLGMAAILAIPPSGLFAGEFLIFKQMIASGQWIILVLVMILLCCVIYGMATRVLHMLLSGPYVERPEWVPGTAHWTENIGQWIFLAIAFLLCFYQPPFLTELINGGIAGIGGQ
jgi:hydrogenase-4 component F